MGNGVGRITGEDTGVGVERVGSNGVRWTMGNGVQRIKWEDTGVGGSKG